MTIWELRYAVESHIMVWHVSVVMLALGIIAIFGYMKVRKW